MHGIIKSGVAFCSLIVFGLLVPLEIHAQVYGPGTVAIITITNPPQNQTLLSLNGDFYGASFNCSGIETVIYQNAFPPPPTLTLSNIFNNGHSPLNVNVLWLFDGAVLTNGDIGVLYYATGTNITYNLDTFELFTPINGSYFPDFGSATNEVDLYSVTGANGQTALAIGDIEGSGRHIVKINFYSTVFFPPPNVLLSSTSAVLTLAEPPTLNGMSGQSVTVSNTAYYNPGFSGASPLAFQWEFAGLGRQFVLSDGVNIIGTGTNIVALKVSGSGSSSLQVTPILPSVPGDYQILLVLTNAYGAATNSAPFNILPTPLEITEQPRNLTVINTSNAVLHVEVSGSPPIYFQWQHFDLVAFDWVNVTNNSFFSGAGSNVMDCSGVTAAIAGSYRVLVSNADDTVMSDSGGITIAGVQDMIPPSQYSALVDFYNSTGGADWVTNTGWLSPHYYPWFGLEIDEMEIDEDGNLTTNSGVVLQLSLPENKLSGTLISSFQNLTNISSIDLSDNELTAALSALDGLTNLEDLDLSKNNIPEEIPAAIQRLAALHYLNLSENPLTGAIPPEIGDLGSLTNLQLSSDELTGALPANLTNLTSLVFLDLSDNELTGPIPSGIDNCTHLKQLNLSANSLSESIPRGVAELNQMETLNLASNAVTGPIPGNIGNLGALQDFILDDNHLSGPVPPQIGSLSNLVHLRLNDNAFSNQIPDTITNLASLRDLDLSDNQFSGGIPQGIGNLSSLENLAISQNDNLGGPIPLKIGSLSSLTNLDLSGDDLTGTIPSTLGNLSKLEVLDLSQNQLSGAIPSSLSVLTALSELNLSDNDLTNGIPLFITTLPSLEVLDLSNNHDLQGQIPNGIAQPLLRMLALNDDGLTGQIPPILSVFAHLEVLDLGNNGLSNGIPPLGNLTRLRNLDLSDNSLSGAIPSLGNLLLVTNVSLNNNALTGSIPSDISLLVSAENIDVSGNQLSGYIVDMHSLTNLQSLSFRNNDLDLRTNTSVGRQNGIYIEELLGAGKDVDYFPQNPPSISMQPSDVVAPEGSNALFSVSADGAPGLSYQWTFDGTNLDGATNSVLLITNSVPDAAGEYRVLVSNPYANMDSEPATLTVIVTSSPPVILSQPRDLTLVDGATAIFSIAASGAGPLSYMWTFNGTNLADGSFVNGSQSASLRLLGVTNSSAGTYRVSVSNSVSSVLSSPAHLRIIDEAGLYEPLFIGKNFNFALASIPGSVNYIWTSTNMHDWQIVGTNVAGASGVIFFTDTNSSQNAEKFYRFSHY